MLMIENVVPCAALKALIDASAPTKRARIDDPGASFRR